MLHCDLENDTLEPDELVEDDWDDIRSSILDGKADLIQMVLDTKIRVLG